MSTTNIRRDSTPINFTSPMNVIREEEKSSQNIPISPPSQEKSDLTPNSSITPNEKYIRNVSRHQRHSSKTTKKLEQSIASLMRSNELGSRILNQQTVLPKSSAIVFSKHKQRIKRKELKKQHTMSSNALIKSKSKKSTNSKKGTNEIPKTQDDSKRETFKHIDEESKHSKSDEYDNSDNEKQIQQKGPETVLSKPKVECLKSSKNNESSGFKIKVIEPIEIDFFNNSTESGFFDTKQVSNRPLKCKTMGTNYQISMQNNSINMNDSKPPRSKKLSKSKAAQIIQKHARRKIAKDKYKVMMNSKSNLHHKIYHRIL